MQVLQVLQVPGPCQLESASCLLACRAFAGKLVQTSGRGMAAPDLQTFELRFKTVEIHFNRTRIKFTPAVEHAAKVVHVGGLVDDLIVMALCCQEILGNGSNYATLAGHLASHPDFRALQKSIAHIGFQTEQVMQEAARMQRL